VTGDREREKRRQEIVERGGEGKEERGRNSQGGQDTRSKESRGHT